MNAFSGAERTIFGWELFISRRERYCLLDREFRGSVVLCWGKKIGEDWRLLIPPNYARLRNISTRVLKWFVSWHGAGESAAFQFT